MTGKLTHIWRYPIKGIGSEALSETMLTAGAPLPGDRAWALLHAGGKDHDQWQRRRNFLVVASGPKLAQVSAKTEGEQFRLSHPSQPDLLFDPQTQGQDLINWATPLWPEAHSAPKRLVKAPPEGMADNGLAQVSIMNMASLRALSQKLGAPLDPLRFRGNLWLDGLAPWEEFDWIDKTIQIGPITFSVTERIERCRATEANPKTGARDVDPVRALTQGWGHKDFGVYASVATSGVLRIGDALG